MKPLKSREGQRTTRVIISWLRSYGASCGSEALESPQDSAVLRWVWAYYALFLSPQLGHSRVDSA